MMMTVEIIEAAGFGNSSNEPFYDYLFVFNLIFFIKLVLGYPKTEIFNQQN